LVRLLDRRLIGRGGVRFLITVDDPDPEVARAQIAYYLEGVIGANRLLIRRHGRRIPHIYRSGVRYQIEESAGDVDPARQYQTVGNCLEIMARRFTECMGASAWLCAWYRERAASEDAARRYGLHIYPNDYDLPSGLLRLFHVQVARPDGSIEDPSKVLQQ
jgi:hypothetical protein